MKRKNGKEKGTKIEWLGGEGESRVKRSIIGGRLLVKVFCNIFFYYTT